MTLRLFAPSGSYRQHGDPLDNELNQLSSALFSPQNWGRDIVSRETASLTHPVHQLQDGSYKMEIYLDVHRFKPAEVKVTTKENRICVEAHNEHKSADGHQLSVHSFRRELAIPAGVTKEEMTAKFTEEGGLVLEAPCVPPQPKEKPVKGDTPLSITHH